MKIAVLSDIHANQEALESVLEDADRQGAQRCWFLGDAIGYGPDPHVPLLWLKYYVDSGDWILGNHDAMYAGLLSTDGVGGTAIRALEATRRRLSEPENQEASEFCRSEFRQERTTPLVHSLDGIDYLLVHSCQADHLGNIRYVYAWQEEIFLPDEFAALHRISQASGLPCVQFYGHTHVPTFVSGKPDGEGFAIQAARLLPETTCALDAGLTLVNPGSVGFPRDLNDRASYAILDTAERTVTFRRVAYDWGETAAKLSQYGYPDLLRNRLRFAEVDSTTPQDWRQHYQDARTE